jgi:hypothetical protein
VQGRVAQTHRSNLQLVAKPSEVNWIVFGISQIRFSAKERTDFHLVVIPGERVKIQANEPQKLSIATHMHQKVAMASCGFRPRSLMFELPIAFAILAAQPLSI